MKRKTQPVTPCRAARKTRDRTPTRMMSFFRFKADAAELRTTFCGDITEPTHLLRGSLQKRLSRNSRGARSGSTFLISEPSGYRILVLSMCGAARRQLVFCLFTERQVVGKASCFLSCARITLCWRSAAA